MGKLRKSSPWSQATREKALQEKRYVRGAPFGYIKNGNKYEILLKDILLEIFDLRYNKFYIIQSIIDHVKDKYSVNLYRETLSHILRSKFYAGYGPRFQYSNVEPLFSYEQHQKYEDIRKRFYMKTPPFGFMYDPIGKGKLIEDPYAGPIVKRLFQLRSQDAFISIEYCIRLITKEFDHKFKRTSAFYITKNKIYMGGNERFRHSNIEPLISEDVFNKAQRDPQEKYLSPVIDNHIFKKVLFRRYLRCTLCNKNYCFDTRKSHKYYVCKAKKEFHSKAFIIREEEILFALQNFLKQRKEGFLFNLDNINILKERYPLLFITPEKKIIEKLDDVEVVPVAPVINQNMALSEMISICCSQPHSLEELMAITQKDMADIQMTLVDMQINGIIEQDELGNWKLV